MHFHLENQTITSFRQRADPLAGDAQSLGMDAGEYIFETQTTADSRFVISSISDHSLVLSDPNDLRIIDRIAAHSAMISRIEASSTIPWMVLSASEDKHVCVWDLRATTLPVIKLKLIDEVTAVAAGVNSTLLAAAYETTIDFYDIRQVVSNTTASEGVAPSSSSARRLGTYSDVHSDLITQLKFNPVQGSLLTSAAEDGLVCTYDTSTAEEEEAIVGILNTECPVQRFGYFGVGCAGLYVISSVETLSFWHQPTAQRVANFTQIRDELFVDYLVDCISIPDTNYVYLIAGDYSGKGIIANVVPDKVTPIGPLDSGHSANIRCCCRVGTNPITGNGKIITGGEDARLCGWKLSNTSGNTNSIHVDDNIGRHEHRHKGGESLRARKDGQTSISNMRFKPY
mmetsp:Transcript_28367/g.47680  ORF Transcript_28367/g.47680 Transcript_28367/m.47680 type:complete len:399 (-) Transcript_28367:403-1599(-)